MGWPFCTRSRGMTCFWLTSIGTDSGAVKYQICLPLLLCVLQELGDICCAMAAYRFAQLKVLGYHLWKPRTVHKIRRGVQGMGVWVTLASVALPFLFSIAIESAFDRSSSSELSDSSLSDSSGNSLLALRRPGRRLLGALFSA